MGWFSDFLDDTLGLDPNGQGIYGAARDVLGDTIADDILGMDPSGGGAIGAYNVAIPLAGAYFGAQYLGGLGGGAGAAGAGIAEGMAPGVLAPATAAEMAGVNAVLGGTAAGLGAAGAAGAGAAGTTFGIPNNLLGAGISTLGSLYGGQQAASAAKDAAQVQADAYNRALALQQRMYEEGVARQQPFYEAGKNALAQLQGQTGAMPPAFQYRPEQLTTDPGYGFRLSEGLKALERSAAARGGLMSGATGKALQRYGQEMGSQEFGNAYNRALTEYNALRQREAEGYNRLAGLAGVGGTTAQQLTSAGQQYSQQAGNLATQQGSDTANALLTGAAARQSTYGDIGNIWSRYLTGGK